jgi:RNase P/RNase MRP subunit p30
LLMAFDIVFPDNNEGEFLRLAEKLGYAKLIFVYDYRKGFKPGPLKSDAVEVTIGILAAPKNVASAKKLTDLVLTKSSDSDRYVIEKLRPNMILELENQSRRDSLHARNSGLNQVLCALLHKNNIAVGISLSMLFGASGSRRILLLGRVMQNFRLCQKYRVRVVLASFAGRPYEMRNPHDILAFGEILGLHSLPGQSI